LQLQKNISIAIVDTNKMFTIKLKLFLVQEEFKEVKTFNSLDELYESKREFDVIIISEELFNHSLLKYYPLSIFLVIGDEIKEVENFRVFYLQRDFSENELKQEINTISLIKVYEREMEEKNKKLSEALEYISQQEEMAAKKQLNMIFDNISFHKIKNMLIDSVYTPKDKLSGDSYIALEMKNKIFLIIIDAMGKGISASLTSTLVSGIGNFILSKTDDLQELLHDYIEYVKTILLEKEALCMTLFEIDTDSFDIKVVNYGMPPVYILDGGEVIKIKPNNKPIIKDTATTTNIDTIKADNYDKILIFSDGLIESPIKDSDLPYYFKFIDVFKKHYFLRDLIRDFKHTAIQQDDITVFSINKPPMMDEIVYSKEHIFKTKSDLDDIINGVDSLIKDSEIIKQKIFIILQELLLNVFEHAYRHNYDKQEIIKNEQEFDPIEGWLRLEVRKNKEFYYIIVEDRGKGFDITKILRLENQINFKRFHRRGLMLILNTISGLFFENGGRKVNVYIRRENEA